MKNIQIITHESKLNDSKVLMAGAYCRVSTDSKDQEESYEAQYNYYSSMFKNDENAVLIITHNTKILHNLTPDFVHILVDGKIVKTGNAKLAKEIEENGYRNYKK